MNRTFSTPIEDARRMFLVLNESLANDPEFVDEFLEDEGYDIEALDKKAVSFFKKLALSDITKQTAIEKQKNLEDARKQVEMDSQFIGESEQESEESLALESSLFRGFKGRISPEDTTDAMRAQAVLSLLKKKDENATESK